MDPRYELSFSWSQRCEADCLESKKVVGRSRIVASRTLLKTGLIALAGALEEGGEHCGKKVTYGGACPEEPAVETVTRKVNVE